MVTATKADIAKLKGKIESLEVMVKINLGLTVGLYVGIILLFADKIIG